MLFVEQFENKLLKCVSMQFIKAGLFLEHLNETTVPTLLTAMAINIFSFKNFKSSILLHVTNKCKCLVRKHINKKSDKVKNHNAFSDSFHIADHFKIMQHKAK